MKQEEQLRLLEGLHTVETVAETLNISKQSALNLLTRLKKEQHVTVSGGGRQKRLYKITLRQQLPRVPGMWDILNKYNPHFQLNPWYDHQVHGKYTVEDVIVEAVETQSFRIILATLRLFNHVTDWSRLYHNAQQKRIWRKVGALYDVARLCLKVRKMPEKYRSFPRGKSWLRLTQRTKLNFPEISNKWKVYIPFNQQDMREIQ